VDRTKPNRVGVIMAGGSGERFWPLSRRDRPKQLLKLVHEDRTLLEDAVQQLLPLIPPERLFIATGEHLREPILKAGLPVPPENVLAEPCKRNTAGCLAFVTAHLLHRFGDEAQNLSLAVTAADLPNWNPERYRACVVAALQAVEAQPVLAVFGIQPTRPETGYGYVEIAEDAPLWGGSTPDLPVFRVERFREKPSREEAGQYLATGRFFWNSGMFFWRVSTFLSELERAQPQLARAVLAMATALQGDDAPAVRDTFEALPDLSIDYALMEHASEVVVVRADFPWDDISSWESLARQRPKDEDGNVTLGDPVLLDTSNCLIVNEPGAERMAVGILGASDLTVVVTEDAVLIAPNARVQDVRKLVARLREEGRRQV
jgi:mannose-1-phosphate guanylyltransferase